jgi:protein SCO1
LSEPPKAAPRRPPWGLLAPLGLLGVALAASGLLLLSRMRSAGEPPVLGQVPPFSLVRQDGSPVTLDDLRGHPWIADFIFTRCGGSCPVMTGRLASLRTQLPQAVRLVSFTVDPVNDTPEALTRYARDLHPGTRWLFVTGDQRALYALASSGFKLGVFEVPPGDRQPGDDGPFRHSTKFVLVDAAARIRGYYDSADEGEIAALLGDLRRLES